MAIQGDVARIWFYMRLAHGVEIPPVLESTLIHWSELDPVSSWESVRNTRIKGIQGNTNPYVEGVAPRQEGACTWESF